jgi:TRAP transporter TAXI family solute receptor
MEDLMKKTLSLVLAALMLLTSLLAFAGCGNTIYVIETGSETGTYYGFTNMIATTLGDKAELGYTLSAVSSKGSKGNIQDIDAGKCQLAIVQNDVMSYAYSGTTDMFGGAVIDSFSVVGVVYQETVQIIGTTALDANGDGLVTVDELKGKRVSIGEAGSGVTINAKQVFEAAGMKLDLTDTSNPDKNDVVVSYYSVKDSCDKMKDGEIDAFFFTAGVPTSGITELIKTTPNIAVVTLTEAQADALISAENSFYSKVVLTNDIYECIAADKPATAVAVSATYIASNKLSEADVYAFTKALWENVENYGAYAAQVSAMKLDNAAKALGGVPLHEGAAKYYREMGIID